MGGEAEGHGVIVELVRRGRLVRASAMDPASLTEVVLQGPAAAGEPALRRAVLQKLAYVLARRAARDRSAGKASCRGRRPG